MRVETIRRLMAQPSAAPWVRPATMPVKAWAPETASRWLPFAASMVLAASSAALWMLSPSGDRVPTAVETPAVTRPLAVTPDRNPSLQVAPQTFAVTLSPVAVRGASSTPDVVVPDGIGIVSITFEGEGPALVGRASVRTVGGKEIWEGALAADNILPAGIVARLQVPAASLPPDDYIVSLYSSDRTPGASEGALYFLRVRSR